MDSELVASVNEGLETLEKQSSKEPSALVEQVNKGFEQLEKQAQEAAYQKRIDYLADRIRDFKIVVSGGGSIEGGFGKIPDQGVTLEHLENSFKKFRLAGTDGLQAHGSIENGYVIFGTQSGSAGATGFAGGSPPPTPTGACCTSDGRCSITTEAGCTGDYQGDNTVCSPNPCVSSGCPPPGTSEISVTFSGIVSCGCQEDLAFPWLSSDVIDFGVNGTFTLSDIGGGTFLYTVPSPGLFQVDGWESHGCTGGGPHPFIDGTDVLAVCSGGLWQVSITNTIYAAFGGGHINPVPNSIVCGPDGSSGMLNVFHGGSAIISW